MMLKDDARDAVVREWLALPRASRATEHQAFLFAIAAKERFRFRCSGDPYQHIKGWLMEHVGRDC
ncbi:MAG: hypothetical protein NT015_09670 [Alphaproteobacteria bacterium]|nr:hypothetical protein [Alphaproteobacteria bacterium]